MKEATTDDSLVLRDPVPAESLLPDPGLPPWVWWAIAGGVLLLALLAWFLLRGRKTGMVDPVKTREEAYRLVQTHAMASWENLSAGGKSTSFLERLLADKTIRQYLSADEIRHSFDLNKNLRHVDTIFRRLGLEAA